MTYKEILRGRYPQKNRKNNLSIKQQILDIDDGFALLISKYAIIPSGYCNPDDGSEGVTRENSIARKVCNVDFYNRAFVEYDKQVIFKRASHLPSVNNSYEVINCDDNVFLLN